MNFQLVRRTAESVAPGHPDKLADRISDTLVDCALRQRPTARVALEVLVSHHRCVIAGEVTGADLDFVALARMAFEEVGYGYLLNEPLRPLYKFVIDVEEQAREIAGAVGEDGGGAGDQGIVIGYACNETDELMPAPILYANRLQSHLSAIQKREPHVLGPDGKVQVTLAYDGARPLYVETLVVSHQHKPDATRSRVQALCREAIRTAIPEHLLNEKTRILINPAGSFIVGGPEADTGVTGRKLAVDSYGPAVPHGGGAFSGKDPTKLDRSGAYAARFVAKSVVAAKLADRCLVEVAYAIGEPDPVAVRVDTFGTGVFPYDWQLAMVIGQAFSFAPKAIRERLDLARPIYTQTSAFGHFGREPEGDVFPWERMDLVPELLRLSPLARRDG